MTEQLKPCPVCGQIPDENWYGNDHYIRCRNLRCMLLDQDIPWYQWQFGRPAQPKQPQTIQELIRCDGQPLEMVTLHDRYAMAALTGLLANPEIWKAESEDFAVWAFESADAMMKQRKAREVDNEK